MWHSWNTIVIKYTHCHLVCRHISHSTPLWEHLVQICLSIITICMFPTAPVLLVTVSNGTRMLLVFKNISATWVVHSHGSLRAMEQRWMPLQSSMSTVHQLSQRSSIHACTSYNDQQISNGIQLQIVSYCHSIWDSSEYMKIQLLVLLALFLICFSSLDYKSTMKSKCGN